MKSLICLFIKIENLKLKKTLRKFINDHKVNTMSSLKRIKVGSFIISALLFIASMITMGFWLSISNKLASIEYGYLNATGFTYLDTGNSKCVHYGKVPYVCCVSPTDYLISWCPVISYNNFCKEADAIHSKGDDCSYSSMTSLKALKGYYVACEKTECDQSVELYNECEVYRFNGKEFMYCSNENVPMNQPVSFDFSYKPGYYNLTKFDDNEKFYKESELPVITENEIMADKVKADRCKFAFIFLILLSACALFLGIIILIMHACNFKL